MAFAHTLFLKTSKNTLKTQQCYCERFCERFLGPVKKGTKKYSSGWSAKKEISILALISLFWRSSHCCIFSCPFSWGSKTPYKNARSSAVVFLGCFGRPPEKGCTQRPFFGVFEALELRATAAAATAALRKIGVRKGLFSAVLGVFHQSPKMVPKIRGVAMSDFGQIACDPLRQAADFGKSTQMPNVSEVLGDFAENGWR